MGYRTKTTQFGTFDDPYEYKETLKQQGYTDMDWQNGWNKEKYEQWKLLTEDKKLEDYQWNNTGSHCTYVCHERKVFCSVDMGD